VAAGLADSRQPLEEIAMFSSAERIYKSPRDNKIVVRNTLVYWGDYRESGWKVGTQKLDIFSTLLYEGSGLSIRKDIMFYKQFFGSVLD
jgi:hypothetical protein